MIRLVINADDLGLNARIDEGIFAAHTDGVVTSATVLAVGPTAADAIRRANQTKLGLGLHLCLTTHLTPAAPAREVRWLAPGGRFRRNWAELSAAWLTKLIPADEIVTEFRAQVRRATDLGAQIDHLDTHQHLHLLPGLTSIIEVLAAELGLPIRWPRERPTARWLRHPGAAMKSTILGTLARVKQLRGVRRVRAHGIFESGRLNERRLLRLIDRLEPGDHEIVTHPGLEPGAVPQDPSWRYDWEGELQAVLSPRVREAIARRGIELVTYKQLEG
ncbi:MAG: carbohydrate deacetylase [Archangium sp.]